MSENVDKVTLSVIEHKLDNVAKEMGVIMLKTARSPIFSEAHDFSCFVAERKGRLISQADGLPIHTGAGTFIVQSLIKCWGDKMHDGDIFISNDPYVASGTHLADISIMKPVFCKDELVGFVCNRAHQVDIGGGTMGTMNPDSTEIFHDGLRIPVVKLYDRGELRWDIFDLIRINTRIPENMKGDMSAMIGSLLIGAKRIEKIFDEFGIDETNRYCEALLDYAEKMMRKEIEKLPDGVYEGTEYSNNDVFSENPVKIHVKFIVDGSNITADFSGSDKQIKGYKNCPLVSTYAALYVAMSSIVDPSIPHNEGTYRPIRLIAPEGTVVNCTEPAPVGTNTTFFSWEIVHACWKALSEAVPDKISAGWGKASYPFMSGQKETKLGGERYVLIHWGGSGGAGAVKGRDGFPQIGVLCALGRLSLPNTELFEQMYPVHYIKQEIRRDGGGAGEFRGGTGVNYMIWVKKPALYSFRGEGLRTPSGFGICGGKDAKQGVLLIDPGTEQERKDIPQYCKLELGECILSLDSPGGGGWGDPFKRDPEMVKKDLMDEVISVNSALNDYGVSICPTTFEINHEETERLRKSKIGSSS